MVAVNAQMNVFLSWKLVQIVGINAINNEQI